MAKPGVIKAKSRSECFVCCFKHLAWRHAAKTSYADTLNISSLPASNVLLCITVSPSDDEACLGPVCFHWHLSVTADVVEIF